VRLPCLLLATLAGAQSLLPTIAWAVDVDVLMQTCSACHGGNETTLGPEIPIIAGLSFTVIEDALILFSQGGRPCTSMCAIAASLGPTEKEALANYLEQQTFIPADQDADPVLTALGAELHRDKGCETCHSDGGRNGNGMAPILAGQRTAYLRNALNQVRAASRSGPKVMNQAIRTLDNNEIEALLNYYANNGQQH